VERRETCSYAVVEHNNRLVLGDPMIRKYWFMIFLGAVLVACILALLEPSWEPAIRMLVIGAFAVVFASNVIFRLERIEHKLDVLLSNRSSKKD
jgi:hypothetical protein